MRPVLSVCGLTFFIACSGGGETVLPDAGPDAAVGTDMDPGVDSGSPDAEAPATDGPAPTPPPSCMERGQVTLAGRTATQPALLWNGTEYFVVWSDARESAASADIRAAFIDRSGAPVAGKADLVLVNDANRLDTPEVARSGTGYVLVWESCAGYDGSKCAGGEAVASMLVAADGTASGAPNQLSGPAAVQRRPYVVDGGGKLFAAFRDVDASAGNAIVSRVVALDAQGRAQGAGLVLGQGQFPYLAWGNNSLAAVFRKDGMAGAVGEVVFSLLTDTLQVTKQLTVRPPMASEATNPTAAWNGAGWTVAWEDFRANDERVYAALVTPDASSAEDITSPYGGNSNWPAVASDGKTSVIAFYGFPRGPQVLVAHLDAAGKLTGGALQLSETALRGRYPALVYNADAEEYAMVWQDESQGVHFARVKCP